MPEGIEVKETVVWHEGQRRVFRGDATEREIEGWLKERRKGKRHLPHPRQEYKRPAV